jgi:hypothetical protein
MTDIGLNINIKQMIAHDINLNNESPVLFNDIINLTSVPNTVLEFFRKHIKNSLTNKQSKACKFNESVTYVQNKVIEINNHFDDISLFVKTTQEIANFLFSIMKATSTKSSGTLFFLVYDDGDKNYLAIMKMDPNNGIQIDKEKHTLIVQPNMLPNPADKLHKCAFILITESYENKDVHLNILDRQINRGEVSKYFMSTFLQASEILNDAIMTKRVVDKLFQEAEKIAPDNAFAFQSAVTNMFSDGKDIDLDNDMEKLIKPYLHGDKDRDTFIENFKTQLIKEFDNDVKFQFTAKSEPTTIILSSPGKEVKFEFDIELLEAGIVNIDDRTKENSTIIEVKNLKLNKKYK